MTTHSPRAATPAAPTEEPLPDLLALSLTELRRLDHPVLSEVLDELRQRVTEGEQQWTGFTQFSQDIYEPRKPPGTPKRVPESPHPEKPRRP